jgi:hypothetical protein
MPKAELEFQFPGAGWTPAGDKVEGIWEQILSKDPDTGSHTRLLRFDPGVSSEANGTLRHEFWEEVFIVSGDLTDLRLDETFTTGMYACRPPGMPHGPWRTSVGVLMVEFRYGYPTKDATP